MLSARAHKAEKTRHIVGFVRNPYARLVSGWADLVAIRNYDWAKPNYDYEQDPPAFQEWLRAIVELPDEDLDHHFRPQVTELRTVFDQTPSDARCQLWLGQLEKLEELSNQLAALTGNMAVVPQFRRMSLHRPWREYYSKPCLQLAANRFKEDIRLWNALFEDGYRLSQYGVDYREQFEKWIDKP